jgi:hypothetical protein
MKLLPCLALTAALVAAVLIWNDRQPQGPAVEPDSANSFPEITLMLPFARERLARDVIEGRRSLLATATLFGELNRLKGESADSGSIPGTETPLRLPGRTPAERLCQHVERWVRAILRNDPGRKDIAIAHLEAEFQAALHEHGEIRLPDPANLEPVERLLARIRDSLSPLQRRNPCPR